MTIKMKGHMKSIKSILAGLALVSAVFASSSCKKDILDLSPIDYYGSGNFWTTEAQVDGYIYTLNYYLRNLCFNHAIMFGELRGGLYASSAGSSDGSTHYNANVILQNFDADHTGVSTFGSYYGAITQTNLFITRVEDIDFLPEEKKNNYLGIAYGIRAFLYFDLYRIYGSVPLRLDVAVIDGEIDPLKLYMGRHSPDEVMKQIKADLASSLSHFGSTTAFDPYGHGSKITWSKAATEYLAGEVYLWNAKVSVDETRGSHAAEPGDITAAKTYFENVVNNYGLSLQTSFKKVFDQSNKANSEVIFAIRYKEDEASNSISSQYTYLSDGRGALMNMWNKDGSSWGNPLDLRTNGGGQWYEYSNDLYSSMDEEDTRRDATFYPCYTQDKELYTTVVGKNVGYTNAAGVHVYNGDQIYYRLAGAYLALAEIANYQGDNAGVKKYIDLVRARAYGVNASKHEYTPGTFAENELAILHEKDYEFVQEGQRWWDVCRMTKVKGGAVTDHLVFQSEVSPTGALLSTSEAYKLLWPLDKTILGNDPELTQTKGY